MSMMYSDPTAPSMFKYPSDRLFPIQGVIPENELARPRMRAVHPSDQERRHDEHDHWPWHRHQIVRARLLPGRH